jgi:hypothetical protein
MLLMLLLKELMILLKELMIRLILIIIKRGSTFKLKEYSNATVFQRSTSADSVSPSTQRFSCVEVPSPVSHRRQDATNATDQPNGRMVGERLVRPSVGPLRRRRRLGI